MNGHKVNIQKSIVFLYTNNKQMEFEIKNAIPFALAKKTPKQTNKNPSINLNKPFKKL